MKKRRYYSLKGIIIGLLGLSLVIIVHELGHFLACKIFNIHTPTFSIGFDPQLISTKIGSTEFQIGAIPLGGYVSIDPRELSAAAYWKKMIIIFAGIVNNILFALGIFFFMLFRTTKKPIPVIETVKPESPAEESGLEENDRFIAFDNEPIHNGLSTFFQKIVSSPGKTILMTIERDYQQFDVPVTLGSEHPLYGPGVGYLGTPLKTVTVPRPSINDIFQNTGLYVARLFRQMSTVMTMIFKKDKRGGITGPIGIITGIGRSAEYGLDAFLFFIAIINLNLALFNLLPIPFFDGGKALHFTIEAITGNTLPPYITSLIYFIFIIILLLFIMYVTIGDIRTLRKK